MCSSPPYSKVILVYFSSKSQEEVIKETEKEVQKLSIIIKQNFKSVEVLGPRPAMVEKKVNKFTWSLMLRGENLNELHNTLNTFLRNYTPPKSISLKVDVDPYYFD